MSPVRFGFLGAGFVATRALAPAVHGSQRAELYAVAARDVERARALEPIRAADDYAAVLADDLVDVVYVNLANGQHLPWVERSLDAGKHVLCEKPLCLTAVETRKAFDAAARNNRLLVEAAWNRWHPRTQRAARLVAEGALGQVEAVTARFCFGGVPLDNFRLSPALGGGALNDVGCYLVASAQWALGGQLSVVSARFDVGQTGVDLAMHARLSQGSGGADLSASINGAEDQRLSIVGESGQLLFGRDAFTSWMAPSQLDLDRGGTRKTETFEPVDAYQLMVDSMARRVRGEPAWLVEPQESISVAEVLDDIRRAAERSAVDAR